jgi:hypothetical protein
VSANVAADAKIPPPLAEDAGTATRPVGACSICARAILRGNRYALVVPGGEAAHVTCIARRALAPARRAA